MFRFLKSKLLSFVLALSMATVVLGQSTPALAAIPARPAETGTIEGSIAFPGEVVPALSIYAISTSASQPRSYMVRTRQSQASYSLDVEPGEYLVVAYYRDLAGGYTRYVTCGLSASCTDHTLLKVAVRPDTKASAVDLKDWYAPSGTFPAQPSAGCQAYYTVKAGDNLYRIGLKYNLLWTTVAKANGLADGNKILAGQVLCIPLSGSTTSVVDTSAPAAKVPTITITGVERDQTVTIQASSFPAKKTFVVTMGKIGTQGVDGIVVGTMDSGSGSFSVSFGIPPELRGQSQIAIRLQSASGYYSYNWFYNSSSQ